MLRVVMIETDTSFVIVIYYQQLLASTKWPTQHTVRAPLFSVLALVTNATSIASN